MATVAALGCIGKHGKAVAESWTALAGLMLLGQPSELQGLSGRVGLPSGWSGLPSGRSCVLSQPHRGKNVNIPKSGGQIIV